MQLTIRKTAFQMLTILSFVLASCGGLKDAQLSSQLDTSNCNHQTVFNYTKYDVPTPIHMLDMDSVLTNRFSFRSLNAAHAIGLLNLLTEMVNLRKVSNPSIEKRIDILDLSQKINQRIIDIKQNKLMCKLKLVLLKQMKILI